MIFAGYRLPKPIMSAGSSLGTNPSAKYTIGASDPALYRNILAVTLDTSSSPLVETQTSVSSSPVSPVAGQAVTYTATVGVPAPGTGTPTGSVTFTGDSGVLCASVPVSLASPDTASCTVDYSGGAQSDSVTASYSGDSNYGTSSGSTDVTIGAALSLVKSVSADTPAYGAAGDTIDYSYLVTNNGPDTLTSVAVNDSLIPSVSCPNGSLDGGGSETCTGSYTATQADVDSGSITNTATATATDGTVGVVSNSSTATVQATYATSALSITKATNSSGYAAAGDTIGYTYLVANTGTTTLSGVGVSDDLIANVSCPLSSLAPGASETCTGSYTVTQTDVDSGSVTNTADAIGTDPHGNPITSGSSSVTVEASGATSALSITKATNSSGYGAAGDTIGYTYLVSNTGTTTLSGVGVSDDLIANVSCPLSSLAPGASETCTGSYTVTQTDVDSGSVTNTADAIGTDPHGNPITSGSSSVTVEASGATSALSITKATNSSGYGAAGNTIGYTYLVSNTGTTTLSGVGVSDDLIANVSCPHSSLAPGASETCTGSYRVSQHDVDAGSVTNTATAHATSPAAAAVTSPTSSVTVEASSATSKLSLTESTTATSFHAAGDVLPYTFVVKNTGTTTLSGIKITDTKASALRCPDSARAPGASETCTGSYKVTQADVSAGIVTNTAIAHALNPHASAVMSPSSSNTVRATGLRITNASLPPGTRDVNYSAQLHATGGAAPYVFRLAAGSNPLPQGLRMSTTGSITGKSVAFGSFSVTVEVLDTRTTTTPKSSASATLSLRIAS